jgi:glucan phosphoethanolaminetransferase (alkaline phosphatase superfamily)
MKFLTGLLLFFLALLGFCAWRIKAQGFSLATAKRWSLNIFAALLVIGVFGACFFYAMSKGIGDELFVKWMNIILTAAFVFGYSVKKFWRFRKRWAFWVELA